MTTTAMTASAIAALRGAADRSRFGGKAAHLADLLSAGFPVPDGFAIAHDADESTPETDLGSISRNWIMEHKNDRD